MARLRSTDPGCRCGCQVWSVTVCLTEAEGAFASWEGHQLLADGTTERGPEGLAAQPARLTGYNGTFSMAIQRAVGFTQHYYYYFRHIYGS